MVAPRGFLGTERLVWEEFRPGSLFWMPAGSTRLNVEKPRPFALATPCRFETVGTLVYGSTQETEKRSGAASVEVLPAHYGVNRNGLRKRTLFYPGIVQPVEYDDLPPLSGYAGKSLGEMRVAMRCALGVGQGSCLGPDAPPGARRGRIVELNLDARLGTPFAVLLTEMGYSKERRYQVILPIYRGFGWDPGKHDVLLAARACGTVFAESVVHVLLPIPLVQSVWYEDLIARETEHVMDEDSLARIDRALCDYFSLPDPPAGG